MQDTEQTSVMLLPNQSLFRPDSFIPGPFVLICSNAFWKVALLLNSVMMSFLEVYSLCGW